MLVMAINASPRKNKNTALLLQEALKGAEAAGAETEMVHLQSLNFKGCSSCFACKLKNAKTAGLCAMKDELQPVLARALNCKAILLGTPIYFADIVSSMRAFMERMFFPNMSYAHKERHSLFPGRINVGWIYTMNATEQQSRERGYATLFNDHMGYSSLLNGVCTYMEGTDTWQFDDYSRYESARFDPAHKARMREELFPQHLARAYAMGHELSLK